MADSGQYIQEWGTENVLLRLPGGDVNGQQKKKHSTMFHASHNAAGCYMLGKRLTCYRESSSFKLHPTRPLSDLRRCLEMRSIAVSSAMPSGTRFHW